MHRLFVVLLMMVLSVNILGQSRVAITIDDVPNTRVFEKNNFSSKLISRLDSLNIPITIFINEGMIYKTKHVSKNFELLTKWIKRDYTTIGNHTFSHSRYSNVGFDQFTKDIQKGEVITRELSVMYNKPLNYFRFTYNDLGKDSLQRIYIENFLVNNNYTVAPFTIESSDWIFNYLYEYYLKNNRSMEAKRIANSYIDITIKYFDYFKTLSFEMYDREINQIYLCHDNSINADYLDIITDRLKDKGYIFISLDDAMQDEVYKQRNMYNKKWGISWFYRWITDSNKIKSMMHNEPNITTIYKEYHKLTNNK